METCPSEAVVDGCNAVGPAEAEDAPPALEDLARGFARVEWRGAAGAGGGSDDEDSDDERRRRRAAKFGTVLEPRPAGAQNGLPKGLDGSRLGGALVIDGKQRAKKGAFVNSVDIYTQEEQEKARKRAERFGIERPKLVNYKPLKFREDEEQRKKRAERFGIDYQEPDLTGLKEADVLEPRQNVEGEVPRRPEAVHVYGVDVLSTQDIRDHFKDFNPLYVEWINDSSCNVVFDNAIDAKRAVVTMGKPLPPEEAPDSYGIDLTQVPFLWHRCTEDATKDGKNVPLLFRMATIKDVKKVKEGHLTRELWKKPEKRKHGGDEGGEAMEVDDDGTEGKRKRGNRGGRRRKKLDTAKPMEVNDGEGPGSEGLEVQDKGVDLRQLLNKRRHNGREQVKGRSGIFGNSLWDEDLG